MAIEHVKTAPTKREPSEVEGLRAIVTRLREEGRVDDAFEHSFTAIHAVLARMRVLELKIADMRRTALGQTSERIDSQQLELLMEEFAALEATAAKGEPVSTEEEAREDAVLDEELAEARENQKTARAGTAPDGDGDRKHKKRRGIDTSTADVEETTSELSELDRTHPESGIVGRLIGHDTIERLEYEPGRFLLHVTKVARYGFGGDGSGGIISAPAPVKVIPRALAGASLLADIIVSKHADHLPLYRLHERYLRAGIDISRSTLAEWYADTCDTLAPIAQRLFERVLEAIVVRIDASGLKVQDPSVVKNIVRGTMWCLVGDDRDVVFRYTANGKGDTGPWQFLAGRSGYI